MNKSISFFKKSYFILIPPIITVIMLIVGMVHYSSVDDMYMLYISESLKTNSHSEHLQFISVIIGYVLKFLYTIIPQLNWFCILELIAVNLAFITVLKIYEKYEANAIWIFAVSAVFIFTLNNLTYTGISFLCVAAGVLWAYDNIETLSKDSIKHFIYAALLMIIGFMFRNGSALYCVIMIFVPVAFICFIRKNRKASVLIVITLLIVLSSAGLTVIEKTYNKINPEPQLYYDFMEYRGAAYDTGRIDYEEKREQLEEVGISKTDLGIFNYSMYGDANVYTPQSVKAIAECKSFSDNYTVNPVEIVKTLITSTSLYSNFVYIFAAFAVFELIVLKNKRLEILAVSVFEAAAVGYLFFRRRGLARVYNPIVICGIFALLYILVKEKDNFKTVFESLIKSNKIRNALCVLLSLCILGFVSVNLYKNYTALVDTTQIKSDIYEDKDSVYVAPSWTRNYMHNRNATILRKDFDYIPVLVILGEWYIYSDYWNDYFEQNGITDFSQTPFLYLLEDNVKFITDYDDQPRLIVDFLKENYSLDVEYETLQSYCDGKYTVYDFNLVEK